MASGKKLGRGVKERRVTSEDNHISLRLSFPQNKGWLVDLIYKIEERSVIPVNKSKCIVTILEYFLGPDPYGIECKVLNMYTDGHLEIKDKRFGATIESLVHYELKTRTITELAEYWKLTNKELAFLLFSYTMRTCKA